MSWIPDLPKISIASTSVKILHTPSDFYEALVQKSKNAQRRICLSTLYLGNGDLEQKLVNVIRDRVDDVADLKCTILLDHLRGFRGVSQQKSSTTLLAPIADKVEVALYHTPELSGLLKWLLPERTNEIIGLQHMKLYIFDDDIIISGANLSDSYFKNRQDRAYVFENQPILVNFFCDLIQAIAECSYALKSDGSAKKHPNCKIDPVAGPKSEYIKEVKQKIDEAIVRFRNCAAVLDVTNADTFVYPILQMGTFEYRDEYAFLSQLFEQKSPTLKIIMASGYFNCVDEYIMKMNEGQYELDVLVASQSANGFYNATGASSNVPKVYSYISEQFLSSAKDHHRTDKIRLHEWSQNQWTFHAKGLWIEDGDTSATVIGSSNYGYRSLHRDLEAQVLLVTTNKTLKEEMAKERDLLFAHSKAIDPATLRQDIPFYVKFASRFVRKFF